VPNRTGVQLLVHPKEWRHPLGTLRFLQLGLRNVDVKVGIYPDPPKDLEGAVLLFPGEGAMDSAALAEMRPRTIFAIDGTWSQARSIFKKNPWLHTLPRCALPVEGRSRYRVRSEPADGYVSTLEAVLSVLGGLEPEHGPGFEALLDAFDGMQDLQLEYAARPRPRRRKKVRPAELTIPEVLREQPERVVLVHGRVQGDVPHRGIVTWAGLRLMEDERFFGVVGDRIRDSRERRVARMRLSAAELAAGETEAELLARWQAFLRPDDVLCSWGSGSLRHIHDEAGIVLKGAYCGWRKGTCGSIFEVVRQEGLELEPVGFGGQSGELFSAMRPIARLMAAQRVKSDAI